MFRATVVARAAVLVSFIAFAVLGLVKPILVLFGAIDFLGTTWTWLALRTDGAAGGDDTAAPADSSAA